MPRVSIIVEVNPKPGCYDEVNAIVREHADLTKTEEPGACLSFEAMHALNNDGSVDPSKIVIVEIYRDMDAVRRHFADPRLPNLQRRMGPLCEGRKLVICEMQE